MRIPNQGSIKICTIIYIVPFILNKNKAPPLAWCYAAHNRFHCYLDKWLF